MCRNYGRLDRDLFLMLFNDSVSVVGPCHDFLRDWCWLFSGWQFGLLAILFRLKTAIVANWLGV